MGKLGVIGDTILLMEYSYVDSSVTLRASEFKNEASHDFQLRRILSYGKPLILGSTYICPLL